MCEWYVCLYMCMSKECLKRSKSGVDRVNLESFLTQKQTAYVLCFLKQCLQLLGCVCEVISINCQLATFSINT